jgi:hypothetical protein
MPSIVFGVRQNPNPVAPVRGIDGASWNNKRFDFVTNSFQLKKQSFEDHALFKSKDSTHIFKHAPAGLNSSYNSKSFRPEPAVIFCAASLPGIACWLTRDSPANKVNCSEFCSFDIFYISHPFNMRPVVRENALTKWINFNLTYALHSSTFKAKVKTADPRE